MEDVLLSPEAPQHPPEQPAGKIAPWWHTACILLLLATWAGLSALAHSQNHSPRWARYLSMVMMSWMLFGSVIAGIHDRPAFFFATLRRRAHRFLTDAVRGLSLYLSIYASFVVIAIMIASAAATVHALHPGQQQATASPQSTSQSDASAPPPASRTPDPLPRSLHQHLHFDTRMLLSIAPHNGWELLLWIGVSATAGFCEEHVFRGYLLRQALAFSQRIGASRVLACIVSVAATSIVFGSLHLYEGLGGAMLITFLGLVYSIVALRTGNLRVVIVAHFLQDFFAGLFLFLFHARLGR